MKAVIAKAFGRAEEFMIKNVGIPVPGPGELRIRTRMSAVNFVDTLVAAGTYQVKPVPPFIPGGEYAGIVDAIGQDIRDIKPGDHVCGSGLNGSFAEMVIAQRKNVYPLPETMPADEAAIFRVNNLTAYNGLVRCGNVKAGETIVVLGASGGVGRAAVQIAKAMGCHVIASASTIAKRSSAQLAGADAMIDSGAENWREQVEDAAQGKPVDIVVDPVGGTASEPAFRSLSWGGRHLVIGFASGSIPAIPTNLALVKGTRLVGVNIRRFNELHPDLSEQDMKHLISLWKHGKLCAPPRKIYPFNKFPDALHAAADRDTIERIILDIGTTSI